MTAYYNEFDPLAAAWLRELIKAGHIAPGDVDERSILEVHPDELKGYTQCHFFAGIGGWSLALRLAGWADDRPVWTGSCPCQPFSSAGKQKGTNDDRHLWPDFFYLISQCRPATVFGEQVEAAIRHGWLDLVQADLEGIGYAVGATCLPAACVGAPHIRQRLWFVADSQGLLGDPDSAQTDTSEQGQQMSCEGLFTSTLANNNNTGSQGHRGSEQQHGAEGRQTAERHGSEDSVPTPLSNANGKRCDGEQIRLCKRGQDQAGAEIAWNGRAIFAECRDGKARPIPAEPAFFPLADGVSSARVGILRGAGNAIVPQVAAAFIRAYMEAQNGTV